MSIAEIGTKRLDEVAAGGSCFFTVGASKKSKLDAVLTTGVSGYDRCQFNPAAALQAFASTKQFCFGRSL